MRLLSELLDGLTVYISESSVFKTEDLGKLLAQHGAVVSLHVNSRVCQHLKSINLWLKKKEIAILQTLMTNSLILSLYAR